MNELLPCPSCRRHVRKWEAACPFCTAELQLGNAPAPVLPRGRLSRAATFAFGATLAGAALVACGGESEEGKQGGGGESAGGSAGAGSSAGGSSGSASAGKAGSTSAGSGNIGGAVPVYGAPAAGSGGQPSSGGGGQANTGGGPVPPYGAPPSEGGAVPIYGAAPAD